MGRITISGQAGQIVLQTPSPKWTGVHLLGGVAQAVECLLYKCEVLSSNPSPDKNKQTENPVKKTRAF
jgi:hypothetical protein